jgi:hypothetical protein
LRVALSLLAPILDASYLYSLYCLEKLSEKFQRGLQLALQAV